MKIITREKARRTVSAVLIIILSIACCFFGIQPEESLASEGLTIKAGFYGGPYYEVKTFGNSELAAMADNTVYLYTGVDAGGFMTASYAWGVPIETLVNKAGINQNSVNYLYFRTSDTRDESIVTYRASALMGSRLAYPNMIKAVDLESSSKQQTISSSKLSAEVTSGSKSVPTILALGYTTWSRQEVVKAAQPKEWKEETVIEEYEELEEYQETEQYEEVEEYVDEEGNTQTRTVIKERVVTKTRPVIKTREVTKKVPGARVGFRIPSAGSLGRPSGYRLTYGQGSILENNVRTSSKYISGIDVQLAGAPNIKVTKKLISGKDGEIGSKYSVQVKLSLPDYYRYIPKDVQQKLLKQVLEGTVVQSADSSALKLEKVEGKEGQYTAEIIGEGSTDINYSYSRNDYQGKTETSGSIGLADMAEYGDDGQDKPVDGDKPDKDPGDGDKPDKNPRDDSNRGPQLTDKDKEKDRLKDKEKEDRNKEAEEKPSERWMAADQIIQQENASLQVSSEGNLKGLAGAACGIFAAGVATALIIYRRRI